MSKSLINVVINSKVIGIANVQELRTALIGVQQAAEQSAGAMAKWDAHKTITACGALSSSLNNLMSSLDFATEGFESFDKAMRAANTMAGKDAAGFERLKDQVTELGKSIPLSRDALANGLYQVISNGVPEDNWLAFLEASAKSAVGGLADLGGVDAHGYGRGRVRNRERAPAQLKVEQRAGRFGGEPNVRKRPKVSTNVTSAAFFLTAAGPQNPQKEETAEHHFD